MYPDILVHFDGSDRATARLDLAIRLAMRRGGRLTGLFARIDPDERGIIARRASARLVETAARAEEAFRQACAGQELECDWLSLSFGDPDFIIREMAICSRYSDLTVLGQFDPEHDREGLPAELNEEIVRQSGGPVLLVPFAGSFAGIGRRILVAWNGSREAARAVRDAMPFLTAAAEVRVLGLHLRPERPQADLPRVNIAERLRRNGIETAYDVIAPNEVGTMDMILSHAADAGADLLVMGAFGSEGVPGFGRAAGTRFILGHMTIPVLMSH
jgi:nucleotide-binding universal stress UspA family protein